MPDIDQAKLRDYLAAKFNLDELHSFCVTVSSRAKDMGVPLTPFSHEDIAGNTKVMFAQELVNRLYRRSALHVLLDVMSETDAYAGEPFLGGPPPKSPITSPTPEQKVTVEIDLSKWQKPKIRALLLQSLDDTRLIQLCDNLPELNAARDEFSPGMSKVDKVQKLVDYCELNALNDTLLRGVRAINPRRFDDIASQP